ncbi:TonB-dependent receptor [Agarilytica rhodophyticola]|uniref:TonB-dependent receptor n=1 Tax=Agarilytica rhodophyticola TaxID=1737490 RepID=UPI0013153AA2|nr:TonB-dependent receptor [Agarilytica rhodophyticola]
MKPLPILSTLATTLIAISDISYANDELKLEELIVTAQKRNENLLQVPVSVQLFDSKFLESSNIRGLGDIEFATPSLNFGQGGRKTRGEIAIRGVGDFSRNIGVDSRVVVYIDDVPLGRSSAFDSSLSDIKQIEVLKGPQGTLFGANTIAGAVNIITAAPKEEFSNTIRVEAGNFNHHRLTLQSDIPINEKVLTSIQLNTIETDGFIENITLNRKLQGTNLDSSRLKVQLLPNDKLTLTANFDWLQDQANRLNAVAIADDPTFRGFSLTPNPRQVAHNAPEFERRKIWGGSLNSSYDFDSNFQFISITAYRRSEYQELSEEDYSPLPAIFTVFDEAFEQWTQEFRLVSDRYEKFDFVIGSFISYQEIETQRGSTQLEATGGLSSVQTPGMLENQSLSLYAHGNYRITPIIELTAGARLQSEKKDLTYSIQDTTGLFTNGSIVDDETFTTFLPKIGINFHLSENGLLYSSISRGAKSGGWNADFVTSLEDINFDQEFATSYELGYKAEFLDRRLRVDTTAFLTKFNDFQVFQFALADGATTLLLTNAGEATTQGIELDTRLSVNRYVDFSFNATFLNAQFDEFKNGNRAGDDFSGNDLPNSPELKVYSAIDVLYPVMGNSELSFHLDYSYSDDYFSNPDNSDAFALDSFYTLNANLGLNLGDQWTFSLWGKNLTDELYLRSRGLSFAQIPRGFYEAPRTYGLTIKYTQ